MKLTRRGLFKGLVAIATVPWNVLAKKPVSLSEPTSVREGEIPFKLRDLSGKWRFSVTELPINTCFCNEDERFRAFIDSMVVSKDPN